MKFLAAILVASFGATSALAADLPVRTYTKAPAYVEPGYNWSGFYIGGNAGYGWGRAATDGTQTGTQSVSEFVVFSGVLRPRVSPLSRPWRRHL